VSRLGYLALLTGLFACSRSGVKIALQTRNKDLTDVYVIVGTDKQYWPLLRASESRTFVSSTGLPAELTVLYTADKIRRSSRGPEITAYDRVEITINGSLPEAENGVTYRLIPGQRR
jgi:hypothetical protein